MTISISVGNRIYFGFSVVLALLLVVSVIGVGDLRLASDGFDTYRELARDNNATGQVQAHLLDVRIHAKSFFLTGAPGEIDAIRDGVETSQALNDELRKLLHDPTQIGLIDGIGAALGDYKSAFDKAAALRLREDEMLRRLTTGGGRADQILRRLFDTAETTGDAAVMAAAGRIHRNLLFGRLLLQKFLVDGDPALYDQGIKAVSGALDDLRSVKSILADADADADADAEALTNMEASLAAYAADARSLFEARTAWTKLVREQLDTIGPKVAADIDAFKLTIKATQDTLGPRVTADIHQSVTTMTAVSAIAVLVGVLGAWAIGRSLSRPLTQMTAAMTRLAQGDTGIIVPALDRRDEIGAMAGAVEVFKRQAIEVGNLRQEQEAQRIRVEEETRKAMRDLADSFEASIRGIVQIVSAQSTELEASAQSLATVAEETQRQCTTVASAAEQATANVQTVATATTQLSASTQEIGRQVTQSADTAQSAVSEAARVNQMVTGLAEAAHRIGAVVALINDIASQTNLLALNATIEAARAGEAGKGFAVVANEVKSLANQTARATDEIATQISGVQTATRDAVDGIKGITATISGLNEIASAIASAVEQQGAATQEISRNIHQASIGVAEVSSNIIGVNQASAETGSASTQVLQAAGSLAEQAEHLREDVDRFITHIRQ